MKSLFFIADDLSGAAETGAAYWRAGWPVILPLALDVTGNWPDETMVGLSTESRNLPANRAALSVAAAVQCGLARGRRVAFKKIDSTLRGSPGAELVAMAGLLPEMCFLVTPANPAAGRTVRGGLLRVQGTPVAETEFGRDPASPVRTSDVAELLRLPDALAVRLLPLEQVRAGVEHCQRWLNRAAGEGIRIVVSDAETADDLVVLAVALRGLRVWLPVGAGSLAAALAAAQTKQPDRGALTRPRASVNHRTLFVCGSAHPINRVQARALQQRQGVPVVRMSGPASLPEAVFAVTREIEATGVCTLLAEPTADGLRVNRQEVLATLTAAVAAVDAKLAIGRLFVTGGESAHALCRRLGGNQLALVDEVEPGLVLTTMETPAGLRLVATKPGGFGDERSWLRAWDVFEKSA